ncbi:hypothetical protein MPH_13945 [Macrophomina phaseolina MS6]|uniref:Uncharacterized protein n=1 Tax=Macrophomina phaseolina (strain MS6) TaxID=1126212 RepID=K2RG73_MACPH|nr:hypothetical protein MPH_13945 [Macrophomina phaseolina MS6]
MPGRGNGQSSSYVFKNHVVVAQVSDTAWAQCSITLRLERVRSRGMLSIRFTAEYEGFNGVQYVSLYLTPHNIHRVDASFATERIPPRIAEHIRQHATINSLEDVIVLTVSTSAPGRVICPQAAATLTPATEFQSSVRCFQDICRATEIRFYLPAPNLASSRRQALDEFIRMTTANQLAPSDINLSSLQGGHRGREATWEVFNIPEAPPPYILPQTGTSTASPSSAAKRAASGDRPVPSLRSCTHVSNTAGFETDSDSESGSEPLSHALPGSKNKRQRESDDSNFSKMIVALRGMVAIELATQLPDMMRNLLPGMLPEILRNHLSAALHDQDSESKGSHEDGEQNDDNDGDDNNRPRPPLIANYVQPLVLAHLPVLVQDYMDEHVDMDDVVDSAERNLADVGDAAILDIKEARDECLGEIAAAEADAWERLQAVCWDGGEVRGFTPEDHEQEQNESPDRRAERIAATLGRGLPWESSSQGSSTTFRRCGPRRRQGTGAEPVVAAGQTQPGGQGGQQHPGAPLPGKAATTVDDDTTDEDGTTDGEDDLAGEEDGMTDEDEATAGHDDFGPTMHGDDEPGQQHDGNRTHELSQSPAGGPGHETAAAPPWSTSFVHSETTDEGDRMETDYTSTQEDSNNSRLIEAYCRELHATAPAFGPGTTRSRSPEVRQRDTSPSRLDAQTSRNVRSAASTQSEQGNYSGTQLQHAQVVDDRFSVPSDRSSPAQPATELRIREDP